CPGTSRNRCREPAGIARCRAPNCRASDGHDGVALDGLRIWCRVTTASDPLTKSSAVLGGTCGSTTKLGKSPPTSYVWVVDLLSWLMVIPTEQCGGFVR